IEPELVEAVRRRKLRVEPHGAGFSFSKLNSSGRGDERKHECMRARAAQAPNQISSGEDISPLIATAHLQSTFVAIVQHQVVISLQQRITEFSERDPVVRFQATTDRFFAEQTIDGEMFSYVTQELHHGDWPEPICVVHNARRILFSIEIEKVTELLP